MPEITFNVGGRTVTADSILKSAPKPPPKVSTNLRRTHERDAATVSDGFLVLGYPAGTPESIEREYRNQLAAHERQPNDNKHPGMLDEFIRRWYSKNKPKRIERKFVLASSAEVCAELARKTGWVEVRVEEVLKG